MTPCFKIASYRIFHENYLNYALHTEVNILNALCNYFLNVKGANICSIYPISVLNQSEKMNYLFLVYFKIIKMLFM